MLAVVMVVVGRIGVVVKVEVGIVRVAVLVANLAVSLVMCTRKASFVRSRVVGLSCVRAP